MGSRTRVFLLIVIFYPFCFVSVQSELLKEEAEALKYTVSEHVELFLSNSHKFGEGFGSKWILMPDGNGKSRLAMMQTYRSFLPDGLSMKSYSLESIAELVIFHYYRSKNPDDDVLFQEDSLHEIPFDSTKPTKIIFHGWMADVSSSVVSAIRNAYLAEENVNIIGVDWSDIAEDIYYPNAADAAEGVGRFTARVIDSLVEKHKAKYKDFHLIGHSLGAHVVGFAGSLTKQKIGRITGLDPALPGFQYVKGPEGRLDSSDAEFVDVIHTCAGVLGMSIPIGHVDFYPNGGSVFQPGCDTNDILNIPQACSHSRSHEFFAESIHRSAHFKAVMCKDWDHFKSSSCENVFTEMGEHIPRDTKFGVYYLKTNVQSPFALGANGIKL